MRMGAAERQFLREVRGDQHYCKWCDHTFLIRVPMAYTGDAFVECPQCRYQHPRQFEVGVAVGCEPPKSTPIHIKAIV